LARPGDLLAIITARLYLLLSAKQDYLATRLSLSDIEKRIVSFAKLDVGAGEPVGKLAILAQRAPLAGRHRSRAASATTGSAGRAVEG
jgi:hypothetical protein